MCPAAPSAPTPFPRSGHRGTDGGERRESPPSCGKEQPGAEAQFSPGRASPARSSRRGVVGMLGGRGSVPLPELLGFPCRGNLSAPSPLCPARCSRSVKGRGCWLRVPNFHVFIMQLPRARRKLWWGWVFCQEHVDRLDGRDVGEENFPPWIPHSGLPCPDPGSLPGLCSRCPVPAAHPGMATQHRPRGASALNVLIDCTKAYMGSR